MSPAERQREAERIHKERRSLTRQKDEKRWIPGGEKALPDHSSGGKIYPSDNKYCPPPSTRKVALKVKDLLSDTRDISLKRAQEINRERTIHRLETLPSGERFPETLSPSLSIDQNFLWSQIVSTSSEE
jgi:hypothetical protein